MRLGYIICEDNLEQPQQRWIDLYETAFVLLGIKPHVITSPEMARDGYGYVWRPNHNNFHGRLERTEALSRKLSALALQYEQRGAYVLPTSYDLSYYENKKKIIELCNQHSIPSPPSRYVATLEEAQGVANDLQFPVLLKHPFSCSSFGLASCDRPEDFDDALSQYLNTYGSCVIQEMLPITKDLRVDFVGNQGLLCFWRRKKGDTISSATRFGSEVDHYSIPYEGIQFAIEVADMLDLRIGGIDMAWPHDDITSMPLLLEVSPIFDLNPVPLKPVHVWKKFKKSRHWKPLYYQIHLLFATRQIEYIRHRLTHRQAKPRDDATPLHETL